jgi:hypothetical protein
LARLKRSDSVQVVNPLELLGLHDDLQAIEQVMMVMVRASYKVLAESIVKKVLADKQGKRRSDRESAGVFYTKRGRSDTGYRYDTSSGLTN